MTGDAEDNVPVFFAPDDDSDPSAVEIDRRSLIEDEAPIEWQRYQPTITLDQAGKESNTEDDSRYRRQSQSEKNFPPENNSFKEENTGKTPEPLSGDPIIKGGKPIRQNSDTVDMLNTLPAMSNSTNASDGENRKKLVSMLVLLGAVNIFAIGFWCGSFIFPNRRVITSLYTGNPRIFESNSSTIKPGDERNFIAEVAINVQPSVVNVDVRKGKSTNTNRDQEDSKKKDSSGISLNNQYGFSSFSHQQASGLILSSDGYILTNNHVLGGDGPTSIRITFSDNKELPAVIAGRDSYSDLAVLKVDASELPVVPFAEAGGIRPGDWAIAIGSPLGFDHTLSLGIVSALDRTVESFNHHIPLIQTDAAINPGNSGGPIFDAYGRVMGIVSAAITSNAEGIAFAIPIDIANEVARKLISDGKISRPYLGIKMQDIDPLRKKAQSLPSEPLAVIIQAIIPGGPADKAGLSAGDTIVSIDGKKVQSSHAVRSYIMSKKAGDGLEFMIRDRLSNATKSKRLLLEEYPANF